jgi:hypothetical protein
MLWLNYKRLPLWNNNPVITFTLGVVNNCKMGSIFISGVHACVNGTDALTNWVNIPKTLMKSLWVHRHRLHNFIKMEASTKPNDAWSLRFKVEVFIWCRVVHVPKSSTIFRGILIWAIFRPVICENTFLCSVLHWRIISIKRWNVRVKHDLIFTKWKSNPSYNYWLHLE